MFQLEYNSLLSFSLSHCLMSQPGPRAPIDVCVRGRDGLPSPRVNRGLCQSDF